jgi:hypothetical protein
VSARTLAGTAGPKGRVKVAAPKDNKKKKQPKHRRRT